MSIVQIFYAIIYIFIYYSNKILEAYNILSNDSEKQL